MIQADSLMCLVEFGNTAIMSFFFFSMRQFSPYLLIFFTCAYFFLVLCKWKSGAEGCRRDSSLPYFLPKLKNIPPLEAFLPLDKIVLCKKGAENKMNPSCPIPPSAPFTSIDSLRLRPPFMGIVWKYPTSITHHFQGLLSGAVALRGGKAEFVF